MRGNRTGIMEELVSRLREHYLLVPTRLFVPLASICSAIRLVPSIGFVYSIAQRHKVIWEHLNCRDVALRHEWTHIEATRCLGTSEPFQCLCD